MTDSQQEDKLRDDEKRDLQQWAAEQSDLVFEDWLAANPERMKDDNRRNS